MAYLKRVYWNIIKVTAVAGAVAFALTGLVGGGWTGFLISVAICVLCAGLSVLFVGCSRAERQELVQMVVRRIRR
jgi:hypothetical protein